MKPLIQNIANSSNKIVIKLLMALIITGCDLISDPGAEGGPGEWKITEIDGFISNVREVGIPLLCDPFEEKYYPVLDDNLTYIESYERLQKPDFTKIPPELIDAGNPIPDTGDVFVFYFTFDNGYYSNSELGDLGTQYLYESLISGTFTYSVGTWRDDLVTGSILTQTAGGGYSKFEVWGSLTSDTRIEGGWEWTEHTAWPQVGAPECDSDASGSGFWVAEKK